MMTYKGYAAAVEIDESVGLLHGRVVNSGPYPIATFEADDVAGLRADYRLPTGTCGVTSPTTRAAPSRARSASLRE